MYNLLNDLVFYNDKNITTQYIISIIDKFLDKFRIINLWFTYLGVCDIICL